VVQTAEPPTSDGPRIGLATCDASDPIGTFRLLEPVPPPPPRPGPVSALAWPLRVLLAWLVNLGALVVAGMLLTSVGPTDPLAYAGWSVAIGVVNVAVWLAGRRWPGVLAPAVSLAALPFLASVLTVWLMTVLTPPAHAPGLTSIGRAAIVLWLANLPLRLVLRPYGDRNSSTSPPIGR
jgi:hypothetical protein